MMTTHKMAERVFTEPFRIQLADGKAFDIRPGEMLMVGKSSVRISMNLDPDPDKPPQWHIVSMALIESAEPLDATPVDTRWGI